MKILRYVLPIILIFVCIFELQAQLPIAPLGGSGFSFRYKSGRLSVSGFWRSGFPPTGYVVPPVVPYGYYGPRAPYFGPPVGIVEKRTVIQVVTPPTVVLPDSGTYTYDVSGVDLDTVSPPRKIGQGANPPPLPMGKKVSNPKKVVRPKIKKNPPPPVPPPPPPPAPKQPKKLTPREKAMSQILLGKAALVNQQYGLATQRFRLATLEDPKFALSYFYLAQGQLALNQYDDAAKTIYEGLDMDPNWPKSKFRPRKELYKGIEPEFDKQLDRLGKVAKANPKSENILFLEAYQLWFDGQQALALKKFAQARKLSVNPVYIDLF